MRQDKGIIQEGRGEEDGSMRWEAHAIAIASALAMGIGQRLQRRLMRIYSSVDWNCFFGSIFSVPAQLVATGIVGH